MNDRQKIIIFMEEKNKIIKRKSGIVYMTKRDIKVIEKWLDEDCKVIWEKLLENLEDLLNSLYDYDFDSDMCPFCIYHNNNCNECSYGKNNGICYSRSIDNRYGKIKKRLIYKFGDGTLVTNQEYQKIIIEINITS